MSEQTDNLAIWNALEVTDKDFTKPVSRPGGFKGTAVDPVYNLKRVTEALGPVGFAWGWTVLSERLDTFGAGEDQVTIHSMTVRAWFRQDDGSVREVDHVGHTKVAHFARAQPGQIRRFDVDEEFGKKSLTDALSKIMMSLGASADIWLGRFDGNKYVPPEDHAPKQAAAPAAAPAARKPLPPLPSPQAEVERALGATVTPIQRPDADADPWKLADVPAENVAAIMIAAIANRPWPEVTAALKVYRDKLTLTPHERELVRDAQAARKDQERQASLLAAG